MIKKQFTTDKIVNLITNLIGTGTGSAIIYTLYIIISDKI